MGDLTKNFSRSEFECNCGCGLNKIDLALVDVLQHSKDATGLPFIITSGCRCSVHNAKKGGKVNSAHLLNIDGYCHAADIACVSSQMMYKMGWDLIRRFRRIEFGKSGMKLWIHVDNRPDLPQDVLILV